MSDSVLGDDGPSTAYQDWKIHHIQYGQVNEHPIFSKMFKFESLCKKQININPDIILIDRIRKLEILNDIKISKNN